MQYRSGAYTVSVLAKYDDTTLLQNYNTMVKDGVAAGLDSWRYPPLIKSSNRDDLIKRNLMMYSAVVAALESAKAIALENSTPVPPQLSEAKVRKSIPLNAVITVLAQTNPKKRGAAVRFSYYYTGMQVSEYVDKVGDHAAALADIRWDEAKGWISISI